MKKRAKAPDNGYGQPGTLNDFSSEEFIERIKARDNNAIEALVKGYNKQLVYASIGLGFDINSACELVQNVWYTFYDVAPRFEGRSHIRTFLFGILYNKASEMRRERIRFDSYDSMEEIMEKRFTAQGGWAAPPMDPEKFILASEVMEIIEKCLETLPLSQRTAFSLREIEGCRSKEICKIMDITPSNLGVLQYRARNRLRECIEKKAKSMEKK